MSLLSIEKILSMDYRCTTDEAIRFARLVEAAVLEARGKQEPVAEFVEDESAVGGAKFKLLKPLKVETKLYAAPVVQPDMVMVPREPTEAMEEAVLNCATYNVEYEEDVYLKNFSECYKFMLIAAAEGKSNAIVTGLAPA